MTNSRSGFRSQVPLEAEDRPPCCPSQSHAASAGHYECYNWLTPDGPRPSETLFPTLCLALRHGHAAFADRLFNEKRVEARSFAQYCAEQDDAVSLRFVMGAAPGMSLRPASCVATLNNSVGCMRLLLENGARWEPYDLVYAATDNRLDMLELVLPYMVEWYPTIPTRAACLGHVRFLMRIFDAGCPTWTSADDGEPQKVAAPPIPPGYPLGFYPVGKRDPRPLRWWCLIVSSDLVCSGPVLLYAAQKGAPLTPRMEGMLGEVRRRARALAGCFYKAGRLAQGTDARAREWEAMGRVPIHVVERIATLAKISIVSTDLVK